MTRKTRRMSTPTKQRAYVCARCSRPLRNNAWIFSRFTGNRYCPDLDACAKRARSKRA